MALGTKCYLPDYTKFADGALITAPEWIDMLGVSSLSVIWDGSTMEAPQYSSPMTPSLQGRNCDDGDGISLANGGDMNRGSSGIFTFTATQLKGVRFVKLISAVTSFGPSLTGAFRIHIFGQ